MIACCCPTEHGHRYVRREKDGHVWWECWYCENAQDTDPNEKGR